MGAPNKIQIQSLLQFIGMQIAATGPTPVIARHHLALLCFCLSLSSITIKNLSKHVSSLVNPSGQQ